MSSMIKIPPRKQARLQNIRVQQKANPRWSTHFKNKLLTTVKTPVLAPDQRLFTMGSCFAERVRLAFERKVTASMGTQDARVNAAADLARHYAAKTGVRFMQNYI